jgi:agmatinase
MDEQKLKALRARFTDVGVFDTDDPVLAAAVTKIATPDGRRTLPYAGVSTFLDLPHRDDAAGLDIAAVGIPMDLGVSNRPGARFGPRAIRAVERIGPYHHRFRGVPKGECRVADIGDVPFRSRYSLEQSLQDIESYYRNLVAQGVRPVSAGGDHSVTYPILKALGADRPVGMIHIDAHCDTGGVYDGSKFHHGGPFRLAVLDGVLDPERTIQIGIRGGSNWMWEFSYVSGMTVICMEDFVAMGVEAVARKAREVLGRGPVYLSIDVDGFDPVFAPGTGTPEVGGLSSREGLELLWRLAGLDFIGADVVEVAPQYDPTTNTAQLGAQLMFEALALMTLGRPAGE